MRSVAGVSRQPMESVAGGREEWRRFGKPHGWCRNQIDHVSAESEGGSPRISVARERGEGIGLPRWKDAGQRSHGAIEIRVLNLPRLRRISGERAGVLGSGWPFKRNIKRKGLTCLRRAEPENSDRKGYANRWKVWRVGGKNGAGLGNHAGGAGTTSARNQRAEAQGFRRRGRGDRIAQVEGHGSTRPQGNRDRILNLPRSRRIPGQRERPWGGGFPSGNSPGGHRGNWRLQ